MFNLDTQREAGANEKEEEEEEKVWNLMEI